MSNMPLKYPWSKWRKHQVLWNDSELRTYLPETALLDSSSLNRFLNKFPVVFAKPCFGGGGRGILQLRRSGDRVRLRSTAHSYDVALKQVYRKVKELAGPNSYIIQQGVDLITIHDSPIDFRVLLLKSSGEWRCMGIMGKVAVKKQFVTNHCRGGRAITFGKAAAGSLEGSEKESKELEQKLESLSLRIAKALQSKYPLITELGLDIGIDSRKHLWLIEANTRPQYKLFKNHEDKALYMRIDTTVKALRRSNFRRPV